MVFVVHDLIVCNNFCGTIFNIVVLMKSQMQSRYLWLMTDHQKCINSLAGIKQVVQLVYNHVVL